MERPDRLGAVFAVAVSLAALSVYLLTGPGAALPRDAAPDGPLVALLANLLRLDADGGGRNLLAATLGVANVALVYALLLTIRIERAAAAWLTVAFAFGTVHWWAAATGDGAGLEHALAVVLATLALLVALGGRWPLLCGLLVGAAGAARLPVLLMLPLFLALYAVRPSPASDDSAPRGRFAEGLVRLAPLGVGVLLPIVLLGLPGGGPYDLDNVPRHVHAALLRSFDLAPDMPWFRPNLTAASLLLTTPLYLWLVQARSSAPVVVWSWLAVALVVGVTIVSPIVGGPQFGYRPSLDAMPALLLLIGWVFRAGMSPAARAAVIVAVIVNTYGMLAVGVLDPPFAGW